MAIVKYGAEKHGEDCGSTYQRTTYSLPEFNNIGPSLILLHRRWSLKEHTGDQCSG